MNFLIPEIATAFMLTFARVGTLVMLMPGIGEQMIPTRARLALALLLTLVLFPLTRTLLPSGGAASRRIVEGAPAAPVLRASRRPFGSPQHEDGS